MRFWAIDLAAGLLLAGLLLGSCQPARAQAAAIPPGYVTFCMHRMDLCRPGQPERAPRSAWDAIADVNAQVNSSIRWRLDSDEGAVNVVSILPAGGAGDCKDYAATKLFLLAQAGVPRHAMRFAVVRTPEGQLHALLIVNVAGDEYALDNRTRTIWPIGRLADKWLAVQQYGEPLSWAAAP